LNAFQTKDVMEITGYSAPYALAVMQAIDVVWRFQSNID